MDGGDVMHIGRTLFVGQTGRRNAGAITQVGELIRPHGYEVKPVEVRGCLHLKTGCSYIGSNTILLNRSFINVAGPFGDFNLLDVPDGEFAAANALLIGDNVIIAASFPKTRALLKERGFRVRTVDVSELQKRKPA